MVNVVMRRVLLRTRKASIKMTSCRSMSTMVADRPVLTLTSHFKVPEQGMEEYEPLSRSSAFIIGSDLEQNHPDQVAEDGTPALGAINKLHFLTSQHVTHPFRFPQYYPPDQGYEFIQFVSEEHMKYTVELRDSKDGNIVFQYPLSDNPNYTFRHPKQDVTCLHVDNDFLFSESLQQHDCNCDILELDPLGTRGNREYNFFGHVVRGGWNPDTEEDETIMKPLQVLGRVLQGASDQEYDDMLDKEVHKLLNTSDNDKKQGGTGSSRLLDSIDHGETQSNNEGDVITETQRADVAEIQLSGNIIDEDLLHIAHEKISDQDPRPMRRLAATESILEMGMCGGPVLHTQESNKTVVGVLEGIVPESHPRLPGVAVIIDSRDLIQFLDDIRRQIRKTWNQ